ncbi:hypothetical protein CAEBREN_04923 [Caenorhabditis brenneri]|uniref:Uncharacterized protein n=1 Tax=Caenorhabditis brenneri TaxID=135651 RepID=G0MYK0_CAEBE|nr:hypothetical protein CAEBREN_04923 [Caenorhabditis brenneri]
MFFSIKINFFYFFYVKFREFSRKVFKTFF